MVQVVQVDLMAQEDRVEKYHQEAQEILVDPVVQVDLEVLEDLVDLEVLVGLVDLVDLEEKLHQVVQGNQVVLAGQVD